jgi:hypothetical protein
VHPLTEREQRQRAIEKHTREWEQLVAFQRGWPLPSMVKPDPPESDDERRQREVRQSFGWEWPGSVITVAGTRR